MFFLAFVLVVVRGAALSRRYTRAQPQRHSRSVQIERQARNLATIKLYNLLGFFSSSTPSVSTTATVLRFLCRTLLISWCYAIVALARSFVLTARRLPLCTISINFPINTMDAPVSKNFAGEINQILLASKSLLINTQTLHKDIDTWRDRISYRVFPSHVPLTVREQVLLSLNALQGAVADLSRAYMNHTSTVLSHGENDVPVLNTGFINFDQKAAGPVATPAEVPGEKKKRKRAPLDPHAPKRPLTPYFLYMETARPKIKGEMPDAKPKEIAEEGTKRWREMLPRDTEVSKVSHSRAE